MAVIERLTAVETKVEAIGKDVTEVKSDVKTLLLRDAARSGGDNRLKGAVPFVALLISGLSAWIAFAATRGG